MHMSLMFSAQGKCTIGQLKRASCFHQYQVAHAGGVIDYMPPGGDCTRCK
jgi:hypothetical protein